MFRWSVLSLLVLLLPQTASAQPGPPRPGASADIRTPGGDSIATATLSQAPDQVLISIAFHNRFALVGTHAIQIHEVGQCAAPEYASAGAIFNPFGKQHGLSNPAGPMAGDLPNLVIGPAGVGVYNLSAAQVTLAPGSASLLQPRGTSLVIFAQADDDRSQPEGNAGARIACGVIVAAQPSALAPAVQRDAATAATIAGMGGLLIVAGVLLRRR